MDCLVQRGTACVTVLDISGAALVRAKKRLGSTGEHVVWIESNVTAEWSVPRVDIWHDRAVFHFLTDPADRARYTEHLRRGLRPGGTLIMATFAPDGPEKCSGLPTMRYSPEQLAAELGPGFRLVESVPELHRTPFGTTQSFAYSRFIFGG